MLDLIKEDNASKVRAVLRVGAKSNDTNWLAVRSLGEVWPQHCAYSEHSDGVVHYFFLDMSD